MVAAPLYNADEEPNGVQNEHHVDVGLPALALKSFQTASASSSLSTVDRRLAWNYFDEAAYVARGGIKQGEDPYIRNRFNQEASDSLPSNRDIPDTRNAMLVS